MARALLALAAALFVAAVVLLRPDGASEGPAVGLVLLALASTGALVAYGVRARA